MKNNTEHFDVYQMVTDAMITRLEAGTVPWVHYLKTGGARGYQLPKNFVSKKPYHGINIFLLGMSEFISPWWLTFKQAQSLGASVRKGERGTIICFWRQLDQPEPKEDEPEDNKSHFVLRYYHVWNSQQISGLEIPATETPTEEPENITPIERAEEIARSYFTRSNAPRFSQVDYARTASYSPAFDMITMAAPKFFISAEEYAACKFHEMAHSVTSETRLNLKLDKSESAQSNYSRGELFAEMSASMLCGYTGILDRTIDNSASYINGWLAVLKADKRAVVVAAGAASKACDFILNSQAEQYAELPMAA